jgi:16S rRNA (uracil1498-N3)-methyltransferase
VRRRAGDALEVVDAAGRLWPATLLDEGPPAAVRVAVAPRAIDRPAPVTLYQGLAEWGRVDLVVEKAAELGVERVVLIATARARRVPDEDAWRRRRLRLERVAEAAARQAGRGRPPVVDGLLSYDDAMREMSSARGILLDPRGDAPLSAALEGPRPERLGLVVGPDTGFDDHEVAAARQAGLAVCHLGAHALRAETAAVVALGLVLAAIGGLG